MSDSVSVRRSVCEQSFNRQPLTNQLVRLIPKEIRNIIWCLVFSECVFLFNRGQAGHSITLDQDSALLLTCKLISAEAVKAMYNTAVFRLDFLHHVLDIDLALQSSWTHNIKHLDTTFRCLPLIDDFRRRIGQALVGLETVYVTGDIKIALDEVSRNTNNPILPYSDTDSDDSTGGGDLGIHWGVNSITRQQVKNITRSAVFMFAAHELTRLMHHNFWKVPTHQVILKIILDLRQYGNRELVVSRLLGLLARASTDCCRSCARLSLARTV